MKTQKTNRLALLASLRLPAESIIMITNIWSRYETELHDCISRHGKQYTLRLYKDSYIFLRNYLLQLPTQPIEFCRVDKRGIPRTLWPLRPLIKGDRDRSRIALCIARSYEQIRVKIDFTCIKSITDELDEKSHQDVLEINNIFKGFLKRFTQTRSWYIGSLQDPIDPWSKVLTTLSKGPNGPAVASSHLDAKAVVMDMNLFKAIKEFNNALKQNWITEWLVGQAISFKTDTKYLTGRLGFSAEPGGKTRVFAIGDYWSQLSLKPIQISLYRTLQQISTDATSNQNKGFKTLIEESRGHPTYCFDLSSASDRIPAFMQKHRLELMSNQIVADNWLKIMTQRDFFIKNLNTSVRWKIGQPLGLLSSFPSFALWHHDIIQLAANWENYNKGKPLKFFKQYRLLGDDVVIFNKEVAMRYQWLLTKLNININLTKSVIGTKESSQIEFAKRLALNGKEMSSIKYNILSKSDKLSLLDLIEILYERDFIPSDTGHYGLSGVLSHKTLEHLTFMLWLRTSTMPYLTLLRGNTVLMFNREDMLQRIISKRTQNIIDKMQKVIALDMEKEFSYLSRGFSVLSVPYSEKALADRSIGPLNGSHPIVLALTQTSRELQFLMFTALDDLEPDTVAPIEYLPIVSTKSYFSSRKASNRYLSEILLACFHEALDEQLS